MKNYLDHLNEAPPLLVFFTNNPLMKPYYGDTIQNQPAFAALLLVKTHNSRGREVIFII